MSFASEDGWSPVLKIKIRCRLKKKETPFGVGTRMLVGKALVNGSRSTTRRAGLSWPASQKVGEVVVTMFSRKAQAHSKRSVSVGLRCCGAVL